MIEITTYRDTGPIRDEHINLGYYLDCDADSPLVILRCEMPGDPEHFVAVFN